MDSEDRYGTGYGTGDTSGSSPYGRTGGTAEAERSRGGRPISRAVRRAADQAGEHDTTRSLLMTAADQIDMLEQRLPELFSRDTVDALERQVRQHPFAMMAAAAGVGFVLQRTGILQGIVGGVLSAAFDGDHDDGDLRAEEQRLLTWLNDAYALELALVPILKNHAEDAERHPHVRKKDLQHLKETRRHAKLVKKCIEHLGGRPSRSKKAIGRITGAMNSVATEPFDDEVVRNFLADYAVEHLEIASYRALIVAAKQAGHPKIARICEQILEDEEAMAEWLEENLPYAVRETLEQLQEEAAGASR